MSLRDEIRAAVFNAKPATTLLSFFGHEIEVRQPSLSSILEFRQKDEEERIYGILLDYAFVPGTDEKVFEPADVEALKQVPFSKDFKDLMAEVTKILGLDADLVVEDVEQAKNG